MFQKLLIFSQILPQPRIQLKVTLVKSGELDSDTFKHAVGQKIHEEHHTRVELSWVPSRMLLGRGLIGPEPYSIEKATFSKTAFLQRPTCRGPGLLLSSSASLALCRNWPMRWTRVSMGHFQAMFCLFFGIMVVFVDIAVNGGLLSGGSPPSELT